MTVKNNNLFTLCLQCLLCLLGLFGLTGCKGIGGLSSDISEISNIAKTAERTEIVVKTDNDELFRDSKRIFRRHGYSVLASGYDLTEIYLTEEANNNIHSLNGDGTVAAYKISYHLSYQIGETTDSITGYHVLRHDEDYYLFSKIHQQKVIAQLRQNALEKLIYQLHLRQNS